MTYAEAIQALCGLQLFGARFGLETPRRLSDAVGAPDLKLRFIHVAGTNGKGSTCAMLESVYRASGRRTGLFTSPHLVSFRERIQVDRQLIPEADLARLFEQLQPHLKEFPPEDHPTFFEVVTVLALMWFAEQKVDVVIWETGLGGRLDATNIVNPLASVITNIGLDHRQYLGDTHAAVAREKAGIIKSGVPVITGCEVPDALQVIRSVADERTAPLTVISQDLADSRLPDGVQPSLPGRHQRHNAALVCTAIAALQTVFPVSTENIRTGLESVAWNGRFQRILLPDGRLLVIDGAHNPEGALVLKKTWESEFPGQKPALILGMMGDKDCARFCDILAPVAAKIIAVTLKSDRSAKAAELVEHIRLSHPEIPITTNGSIDEALATFSHESRILITGSLYLIGSVLESLAPIGSVRSELTLNDWKPAKPRSEINETR